MIAHDKILLRNTFLRDAAQSLRDGDFITKEQYSRLKNDLSVLRGHDNLLVRIGFFLIGELLYSSVVAAVSLFAVPALGMENYYWAVYVYALVGLGGSEILARQHFFRHGLDDAFVLSFVCTFAFTVGMNTQSPTLACIALFVAGAFAGARYLHTLSMVLALLGLFGFFCCLAFDLGVIPKGYVPLVGLLLAVVIYAVWYFLRANPKAYFYKHILRGMQVLGLVLGYVSVNYFAVRELSVALMDLALKPGDDIPFAWLFYLLTFALPMAYIWYGLRIKNKPMLWIGGAAFCASVLTIRYYYTMLLLEWALMLSGIFLFAIAYTLIKKLRHKESGITFERDRHSDKNTMLYAQAILVNSQINIAPVATDQGMPFGGGGFSGGGSSQTF